MPNYGDEISSISLGSIIGGALNAIVEAQGQAAQTTVSYLEAVGFTDKEDNSTVKVPRYVEFEYEKEMPSPADQTQMVKQTTSVKVPLLSLVPAPYIRIDDASVDFNVKINSVEENKAASNFKWGGSTSAYANYKGFRFNAGVKLNASISNQKTSVNSTTVKKDYSLNVHIHAVQDDMPAGLERMLNMLEGAGNTTMDTAEVPPANNGNAGQKRRDSE